MFQALVYQRSASCFKCLVQYILLACLEKTAPKQSHQVLAALAGVSSLDLLATCLLARKCPFRRNSAPSHAWFSAPLRRFSAHTHSEHLKRVPFVFGRGAFSFYTLLAVWPGIGRITEAPSICVENLHANWEMGCLVGIIFGRSM